MTKSQITTAVGGAVAFISGLTAAATPFVDVVPERHRATTVAVLGLLAMLGAGLASFNQSLNTAHVSIPVETAKAAGVAPEQTEGK